MRLGCFPSHEECTTRGMRTRAREALGALAWLAVTFVAAAIGSVASANAPTFYAELVRPFWAPPAWLFGPVWTFLYASMAVAAWWVWHACGFARARTALTLFVAQLVANALWSWLFFGARLGAAAFFDALLLCGLVAATTVAFYRTSKFAAALLFPYLAWCTFAAALTFSIWSLNPALLG
jgi:benzodiazapine receptor